MRRVNRDNETFDLMARKMENDSIILREDQQAHFDRLRDAYTHWLSNPLLSDNRIRDYLMTMHHVSTNQAYRDIALIKMLFGSVAVSNKEQMRYKANFLYDAAAAAAMAGNDAKAKALIDFMGNQDPKVIYTRKPIRIFDGDKIIVSSDGLTDAVSLRHMKHYIKDSASVTATQLKHAVAGRKRPKQDNYTAIVFSVKRGYL